MHGVLRPATDGRGISIGLVVAGCSSLNGHWCPQKQMFLISISSLFKHTKLTMNVYVLGSESAYIYVPIFSKSLLKDSSHPLQLSL